MKRIVEILFFMSWLLCGCGIDTAVDSIKGIAVLLVALAVTIMAAACLADIEEK